MPALSDISVRLLAHTTQFERAMGRAQCAVKKLGIGIGVYLSVRGVARGLTNAAQAVDSIAKTSARLGIAAQQLQAWHLVASRAGISAEQLNMGLQRMTRRVAEAGQGTGEARNALRELGLSAQDLNRLSPDKQLETIVQALRSIDGSAERVRIAFKLFDSEGVAFLQLLGMSANEIASLKSESVALFGLMDADGAKAVEAMNDAWTKMGDAIKGVYTKITVLLAPSMESMFRKTATWIQGVGDWMIEKVDEIKVGGTALIGEGAKALGFDEFGDRMLRRATEMADKVVEKQKEIAHQTRMATAAMGELGDKTVRVQEKIKESYLRLQISQMYDKIFGAKPSSARTDSGTFATGRQIALGSIAGVAANKPQPVKAPEFSEMVRLLREIARGATDSVPVAG